MAEKLNDYSKIEDVKNLSTKQAYQMGIVHAYSFFRQMEIITQKQAKTDQVLKKHVLEALTNLSDLESERIKSL